LKRSLSPRFAPVAADQNAFSSHRRVITLFIFSIEIELSLILRRWGHITYFPENPLFPIESFRK
jgi:hypothetical protein